MPTNDQYDSSVTLLEEPSGLNDSVSLLPFTGFDLVAMILIAAVIIALGVALHRATRRPMVK